MATTKQWMRFFLDAGIPPDSAAHYAVTFEQNRMGLDMVGDLDKEYLRDLKITALGDIISILRAAKKHQDRTEREAAVAKREQVDSKNETFTECDLLIFIINLDHLLPMFSTDLVVTGAEYQARRLSSHKKGEKKPISTFKAD